MTQPESAEHNAEDHEVSTSYSRLAAVVGAEVRPVYIESEHVEEFEGNRINGSRDQVSVGANAEREQKLNRLIDLAAAHDGSLTEFLEVLDSPQD